MLSKCCLRKIASVKPLILMLSSEDNKCNVIKILSTGDSKCNISECYLLSTEDSRCNIIPNAID